MSNFVSAFPSLSMIFHSFLKISLKFVNVKIRLFGLGAKSESLSFVAPPGKRNSIDIMC